MMRPLSWFVSAGLAFGALVTAGGPANQLCQPKLLTQLRDAYPHLSPDGTRIVFQSNRTGNFEISTTKPDGSDVKQLTFHPAVDGTPKWSPNGEKIVFASERDGNSEIYVMNADGSGVTRLTNHPGDDSHPSWSPDGTRIIFNSARATPDLSVDWAQQWHEIFSVKLDGSDLRQHTHCRSICTYPAWSPKGDRIAYRKVTADPGFRWDMTIGKRNSEVFVADLDGSNEVNLSSSAAYDGWPAWSPDGSRILFSSNRDGIPNVGQLYLVNPDGSSLRRISTGPGSYVQGSWSRDSLNVYAYQNWENETEEFGNLVVFSFQRP